MTIKKLSPDKVRITLSHEELAAYEIDWDHLGPDDEPTRELLLQLLTAPGRLPASVRMRDRSISKPSPPKTAAC